MEDLTRTDLRPNLILLAWNEDSGTNIVDVFDLEAMRLYATFVDPDGQLGHTQAALTEQ